MVGTGYVGLVTGTCFANTGNNVTCLDIDAGKIERLRHGDIPIYEPGLSDLIRRNTKGGRLTFTTDKSAAYQSADVIFICVGTPSDEQGHADLKYVLAAADDIGRAIEESPPRDEPPVIVIKSTVPVGTNARAKERIAGQTGKLFYMASNPEFLKEGDAVTDFNKPDRVVLGCESKPAADLLRDLYEPFVRQGNPIFVMDIPSAEMVKYASNAMLATKISFINEVANLCEAYGADIDEVRRGMCADKRIGNQFLYPGLGYGGSCFPKDILACVSMGLSSNTPTQLLQSVHDVNQRQREAFMSKVDRHFGDNIKGRRIAVWGIAFKPGTDDIREAPSITLIAQLLARGAEVVAYDPVAHEAAHRVFGDKIKYAETPIGALMQVDALVICTDWDEFRHPDFEKMASAMRSRVIFDGRNLYRLETMRDSGFTYFSVGRRAVEQTR